jgi:L-ascorbate metabolism protein UlaG (beta-lactamase superfamily)
MSNPSDRIPVDLTLVGGPTMLISIGGLNLLTDPTLDPPGDHPVGDRVLVKTHGPALCEAELPKIDVVLLSHEQHPDNLDDRGRALTARVPRVLTTEQSAAKLGENATGLRPWTGIDLRRPDGGTVHITAVPAQHGPENTQDRTGDVTGFVLSAPDVPGIYISGDNASLRAVDQVAQHSPRIAIAILFGGRARAPYLDAYLTLGGKQLHQAFATLGAEVAVPVHLTGWRHLTEDAQAVQEAFEAAGDRERLILLSPGESCRR